MEFAIEGSLFARSSKVLFKVKFEQGNLEEHHKQAGTKASKAYHSKEDILGVSKAVMAANRLAEVTETSFR